MTAHDIIAEYLAQGHPGEPTEADHWRATNLLGRLTVGGYELVTVPPGWCVRLAPNPHRLAQIGGRS